MSRSTEQLLLGVIPPKEERSEEKEVFFSGILQSVKPGTLSEDVFSVFVRWVSQY